MKILVAEDNSTNARLLTKTLQAGGHEVELAVDGVAALDKLRAGSFDMLLTDWMMPRMDGMRLLQKVRKEIDPSLLTVVITAMANDGARAHALETGADGFIAKPFDPKEVLETLSDLFARKAQEGSLSVAPPPAPAVAAEHSAAPPFPAVAMVTNSGGAVALPEVLRRVSNAGDAAFMVVVHGEQWVIESVMSKLEPQIDIPVRVAEQGHPVRAGEVLFAPADYHMVVDRTQLKIDLNQQAPENYVRPSADILFRSVAEAFGGDCVAAVLTGMGLDGDQGCRQIAAAGGVVLVQDQASAVAPGTPEAVIKTGVATEVLPLELLGLAISAHVTGLSERIRAAPATTGS